MSKDGLIERILSDATATADSIVQKAYAEAKESIDAAHNAAIKLKEANDTKLAEEFKMLLERKKTLAEIDAKKALLAAKVECVDSVFECALDKLCKMDKKAYTDFVLKLLESYAEKGDVVVLSKNANVDTKVLTGSKIFADKGLKFSDKAGEFDGGIVLVGAKYDKSLTFKSLLDEQKSVLMGEVLDKLFL